MLTSADVDHVAQIFKTPLTGSYNWDYSVQDDRIKKLYELVSSSTGIRKWISIGISLARGGRSG